MTVDFAEDCALHEPAPAAFALCGLASRSYGHVDVSTYVMSSPYPAWLHRAKAQLEEFGKLQLGWNSYGAKPISFLARTAAYGLLRQLANSRTPVPALVPTSDGSVQIEWHTRGIDLEIRVLSSTRISICFEDLKGELGPIEVELDYDLRSLGDAMQALSNR